MQRARAGNISASSAGPGPAISPDGFLHAEPDGNAVKVTDKRLVNPDANIWPLPTLAERSEYHSEQAALAEKDKQHFALAFHVGRLLLDAPDDAVLKRRRDQALKDHAAAVAQREPQVPPRMEEAR